MVDNPKWQVGVANIAGQKEGDGIRAKIDTSVDRETGLVNIFFSEVKATGSLPDLEARLELLPISDNSGRVDHARVCQKLPGKGGILRAEFGQRANYFIGVSGYTASCWDDTTGMCSSRDRFEFPSGDLGDVSMQYDSSDSRLCKVNIRPGDNYDHHFIATPEYTCITDYVSGRMTQTTLDLGWDRLLAVCLGKSVLVGSLPRHASSGFREIDPGVKIAIMPEENGFVRLFWGWGTSRGFSFCLKTQLGDLPLVDISQKSPSQAVVDKVHQLLAFAKKVWRLDEKKGLIY